MSSVSKKRKEGSRTKIKSMGDHKEFLRRITKTLYYGELPMLPCLSLPVTELSCAVWSACQRGRSLRRLHADAAASIARGACVSPCALVLALLYLERLNACNPDYLAATPPADLFLVSLMVGNKFLQDDGEDEEVICSEWAAAGGLDLKHLKKLEVEFLNAIDWNVFVSEDSFEAGLSWLERQVALRQAQSRGFFTYSDLAAVAPPLQALATACIALTLAYLTSVVAICTSAILVSHISLPTTHNTNLTQETPQTSYDPAMSTPEVQQDNLSEVVVPETIECCSKWSQYREATEKKTWSDTLFYELTFEPWWSKSVLNWLYRSSLVNPMQRWLEKMDGYADFGKNGEECGGSSYGMDRRCVRQWLNLSKLGAFVTSVSDR